jgi:precorrin-6Y C5,15-methyltransferase (decarboxylating)
MVGGEVFGRSAQSALADADVIVGSPRHLAHVAGKALAATGSAAASPPQELVELTGPLPTVLDRIAADRSSGKSVCVLASGDPGFFGIGRLVVERFGDDVVVLPAPSSVSLAFAAAGLGWDDADVVSAHGRPLTHAIDLVVRSPKVAVLTSPAQPPQCLGQALRAVGCEHRRVVVATRIGEADQSVTTTDLAGLADGQFDPMSVVLLTTEHTTPADATTTAAGRPGMNPSWGAPTASFEHRDGMITKPEVRAVVLGKLGLAHATTLWDLGAGSGSVGIEAATVCPGLVVHAVERDPVDATRIERNAAAFAVADRVHVVVGEALAALAALPDPDRVFVGGGGLDVIEAAWSRLRTGGILVATLVVLDRAVRAMELLGDMIQLHVDRAVAIGGIGMRLEPTNPTFVCWGRR